MEDRLAGVVFLLLLLSRRLRGRIWFHNEIRAFFTVLCLLACSGLLASRAHLIFFNCQLYECTKECNCFIFKIIIMILLSEYVKACFITYQKYWIPNAASS